MNQTISCKIHDVAFGGNGVGSVEGKVVFIPFTIPGEIIAAHLIKERPSYAHARIDFIVQNSPQRVEPRCPYFGQCGGCSYQHMDYGGQLAIKALQVEETLKRIGRIRRPPMQPIVPSPKQYGYRNRIRVHVENGKIGFYAFNEHELIDIEQCPISSEAVNHQLAELRSRGVPDGDYTLAESHGEFFAQTNDDVAKALVEVVRALLAPESTTLVDAYCGAGFFAKEFAQKFSKVIGVEENEFAVSHARSVAQPHENYIAGDVGRHLGTVLSEQDSSKTTLILDPPATGVEPRVLDVIDACHPAQVIYVSCNPATLARDLLAPWSGYRLVSVTPLDMFPQTAEIEVVAHLKYEPS